MHKKDHSNKLLIADLHKKEIKKEILNIIPKELAMNYRMIAFDQAGNKLKVAIENPDNFRW